MPIGNGFYYIDIVKMPIDVNIAMNFVNDAASGSTLLFNGTVRDNEDGTPIKFLYYEAYEEMAFREIDKLISAAFEKYDLNKIAVIHRTGKIEIGGISISIAVSSPHRDASYMASKFLIDNIKETVPIWKKESFGEYEKWKRI
jgi:molybdopterin synthase catalytic subunit